MKRRSNTSFALLAMALIASLATAVGIRERDQDPSPAAGDSFADHASIQFLGLVVDDPIVVEGEGATPHQARIAALRKLGAVRDGKFAKVEISFMEHAPAHPPQWHYWWHNAGVKPHWKPCGNITPDLPVSPFGRKVIVVEKRGSCKIEVRSEPTLANLYWNFSGPVGAPEKLLPDGLGEVPK